MVEIRLIDKLEDFYAAVGLQRAQWGDEIESVVPAQTLHTIVHSGGHVLAAFDAGQMIGVLVGLMAAEGEPIGKPFIYSKRMVVKEVYRNQHVGYALKLAQRARALRQGLERVAWTFDPLLSRNAYFNLRKLGAICRVYRVDYYGSVEAGGLVTLGSSDRLWVEWRVAHPQVITHLEAGRVDPVYEGVPVVLALDALRRPIGDSRAPQGEMALLPIPVDYAAVVRDDPGLARAWREVTRTACLQWLEAGYWIVDAFMDAQQQQSYLVLKLPQDGDN